MRLEIFISDLLYRYQCVTIPEFGSFLAQPKSARIDDANHTFYPPYKKISFNAQLKEDDGLLTKYVGEVQDISFEEASEKVLKQVTHWKEKLQEAPLSLKDLGVLKRTEEDSLVFSPEHTVNYLIEAYGLSSYVSQKIHRETYREEVIALEEKTPITITPERKKKRPLYQYVAAASVLFLAVGFFGMTQYKQQQQRLQVANEQKAQQIVERKVQAATFDIGSLPSLELNVVSELPKYHIIGGAFRVESNAEKKVNQLLEKGFNAKRIGKNRYGLHQVSYASLADKAEALQTLRQIKRTENPEAWLLVTK